jgi:hypothetical protein
MQTIQQSKKTRIQNKLKHNQSLQQSHIGLNKAIWYLNSRKRKLRFMIVHLGMKDVIFRQWFEDNFSVIRLLWFIISPKVLWFLVKRVKSRIRKFLIHEQCDFGIVLCVEYTGRRRRIYFPNGGLRAITKKYWAIRKQAENKYAVCGFFFFLSIIWTIIFPLFGKQERFLIEHNGSDTKCKLNYINVCNCTQVKNTIDEPVADMVDLD